MSKGATVHPAPSSPRAPRALEGLRHLADRLAANPFVAYGLVLVLQLRLIWGIWANSDLTDGDTASYFTSASGWAHGLTDNVIWSPLYTDLWGTILWIVGHVTTSEIVMRLALVLLAPMLVMLVARTLLEPPLAMLLGVWWVVLPPDFNPVYEVHLFGFLTVLAAVCVLCRRTDSYGRGVALGILLTGAFLVRNEQLISFVIFGAAVLVVELRGRRAAPRVARHYLLAYGAPIALAAALVAGCYGRSVVQGQGAVNAFTAKAELTFCQNYAVSWVDRHPSDTASPYLACEPLIQHVFNDPHATLVSAVVENPKAMGAFFAWNTWLMVPGMQISLFGATATAENPNERADPTQEWYAIPLSLLLVAVLIAGAVAARRQRHYWRGWLAVRRWPAGSLGVLVITALWVVIAQARPAAEYMYEATLLVMVLTGLAVTALLRTTAAWRFASVAAICLTVGCIAGLSSYYTPQPRPIYWAVTHLERYAKVIARPGDELLTAEYPFETCAYLSRGAGNECSPVDQAPVEAALAAHEPIGSVLRSAGVTAVFADPSLRSYPGVEQFVADPRPDGFARVASGHDADGPWAILLRRGAGA